MAELNIGVLGSGIVGLTTALELQKRYRNAKIEIVADKFNTNTTSYVAAGLFRPGLDFCGDTEEITRRWITNSYYHWEDLKNTAEASKAGVTQLSGYLFSSEHPHIVRNTYLEKLSPIYRQATTEELQLCPGNWKYGSFFTTFLIQSSLYLPWATDKFIKSSGRIIEQKVHSFTDISQKYDVTVNCTGLGAKILCNDKKLVPMRGQVLKVEAPWIKTFFYGDYDTYVIPGFDSVTLGGCRQYDSYNLSIDKYDGLSIKERCEALVPSLKNAKLVAQRVGLRPYRSPVRVEKEVKEVNGNKMKIVHNYGHGGYGVTTAPGTSMFACDLVHEILTGNSKL